MNWLNLPKNKGAKLTGKLPELTGKQLRNLAELLKLTKKTNQAELYKKSGEMRFSLFNPILVLSGFILDFTLHKEELLGCMTKNTCKEINGWMHGVIIVQYDIWELSVENWKQDWMTKQIINLYK